jgi:hypothetical protein
MESSKIEFVFFRCLYDFSRDFTIFSKLTLLFEIRFYTEVPGTFLFFTDMPLDCRLAPRKIKSFAMWPLAKRRRRARRNPTIPSALPGG